MLNDESETCHHFQPRGVVRNGSLRFEFQLHKNVASGPFLPKVAVADINVDVAFQFADGPHRCRGAGSTWGSPPNAQKRSSRTDGITVYCLCSTESATLPSDSAVLKGPSMSGDYDKKAEEYDWRGPEVAFGLAYAFVNPGESILDIGIGTGLSSIRCIGTARRKLTDSWIATVFRW